MIIVVKRGQVKITTFSEIY